MTPAKLRLLRSYLCLFVMMFAFGCPDGGKKSESDGGADGGIDPSCVRLRTLRSWSAEPSAIAMLFTVESCLDGTPITGLKPEDFTIAEDNERLSSEADPDFVPSRGRRVYITLLLDMSSSTRSVDEQLISGAKTFVNELLVERQLNVAIGIEVFDGAKETTAWQLPIQDADRLAKRLDELDAYVGPDPSSTNLNGAIVSALSSLQSRQQKVIEQNDDGVVTQGYMVIFTDGFDTSGTTTTQAAVDAISNARNVTLGEGALPPVESYAVALAGPDYSPEKLLALFSGTSTGGTQTQCSDSCYTAGNGTCEDGGSGSYGFGCTLGSDCSDCGTRYSEPPVASDCLDTCLMARNGSCDDGRQGSYSSQCSYGTDCADCGSTSPLPGPGEGGTSVCQDSCIYSKNGRCEDGLSGSQMTLCQAGSDCADCGSRQLASRVGLGANAQVDFGTPDDARRHVLEAQNPEELEKRFNDLAAKIALQLEGTYLLAYCSPKRNGTHTLTMNVASAVSTNGMPLTYTFSAEGFDPGCTAALFTSSCDQKGCGGFNCGACDDETEVCDVATDQCESACLAQGICSGPFTNGLGYEQVCESGAEVTQCGSQCVDTQNSEMHCGACNKACAMGSTCVAGACTCTDTTQTACTNGCMDLKQDEQNCGKCGNNCPSGISCTNGICDCGGGIIGCAGSCIDPKTTRTHCGACGNQCPGDATCTTGACVCSTPSLTACPGASACVDTKTDKMNCGACGKNCGPAGTCVAGACQCPEGNQVCGESCSSPLTDPMHCGNCETKCSSTQRCENGMCTAGLPTGPCSSTVISGPLPLKATGTLVGASTTGGGSCHEDGMARVTFSYTPPASGNYAFGTVKTSGTEESLGIELSTGCGTGYLTCGENSVLAKLVGGTPVIVTVYSLSAGSPSGTFELTVASGPPVL